MVTASAKRAVELNRQAAEFKGQCVSAKLFAKHLKVRINQGNLKGELAVAAILLLGVEDELLYLRFFSLLNPPSNFVQHVLPF